MNCDIDRLLFHWPAVVANSDGWAADFAKSIAAQSRRRKWAPSDKQKRIMAELVNDLFINAGKGDFDVIDAD